MHPPDKKKTALAGAASKSNLHKRSYQKSKQKQGRFSRALLPTPAIVLQRLGIEAGKANSAGYWAMACPFHANGQEKHPSLNLHVTSGHYKCHACGAKGGDILAFYRAMTGKNFYTAICDLGAYEGSI